MSLFYLVSTSPSLACYFRHNHVSLISTSPSLACYFCHNHVSQTLSSLKIFDTM
ncbi:hypothetical protein K440DRAFT_625874, partial [Wilcoxina mikolae CBS 423.85]